MADQSSPSPMSGFGDALERFGRIAQGFGYGFRGRTPPFVEEDLQRERMAQQERQFGITEQRMKDLLGLQRQQLERQNDLADVEILKGVLGALPSLQTLISKEEDPEKRATSAAEWGTLGARLLQRVGRKDPTTASLATPSALTSLLLSSTSAKDLLARFQYLTPNDAKLIGPYFQTGKVEDASKGFDLAQKMDQDAQTRILSGLGPRLAQLPKPKGLVPLDVALQQVQATPQERAVVANLPTLLPPDRLKGLYEQYGIEPPTLAVRKAEIPLKAEEARAIAEAKEATPGGRATIALQQAQTTAAETPIVTPLQAGAGFAVTPKGKGAIPQVIQQPTPTPQAAGAIRGEFERLSKDFVTIRDFYGQMPEAVTNPSAAGDLAIIFSYMKILDPSSVVREGEQASAQNATGVPNRIRNLYNRVLSGERLNPEQRQDFKSQAERIFRSRITSQESLEKQYRALAERAGIKAEDVVIDLVGRFRDVGKAPKMPRARLVE